MKKTIYTFNNNTSNNNFPGTTTTNYSKILDDLIATNIINKNSYLNKYTTPGTTYDDFIDCMMKDSAKKHTSIIIDSIALKDDNKFIKAANFLANYKKKADIASKFIFGKTYKLTDGTPIIFYDDEIQIGFDLYTYDDFKDIIFLKKLPTTAKNIIINIYNIILA